MEDAVTLRKLEIREKLNDLLLNLDQEPLEYAKERLREAMAKTRNLTSRPEELGEDWEPPPPISCTCKLCGIVFETKGWKEYSKYCPDHKFEIGKMLLQAEVDAHQQFVKGGCDMYGSMADPNLDRGWLDGYTAGRFDSMVKNWKKEHGIEPKREVE